jgi:hypothetical protein
VTARDDTYPYIVVGKGYTGWVVRDPNGIASQIIFNTAQQAEEYALHLKRKN